MRPWRWRDRGIPSCLEAEFHPRNGPSNMKEVFVRTTPLFALLVRLLLLCVGYFFLLVGALQLAMHLALDDLMLKPVLLQALRDGLFYGGPMAVLLAVGQLVAGRRITGNWVVPAIRQSGRFTTSWEAPALMACLEPMLRGWKWRLRRPDGAESLDLLAHTPPSRLTFGESVKLRIEALDGGGSCLKVTCGDAWTLVDFGRNLQHLMRLEKALASLDPPSVHA